MIAMPSCSFEAHQQMIQRRSETSHRSFVIEPIHANSSTKLVTLIHSRRARHVGVIDSRHGHSEDRNSSHGICCSQITSGLTPLEMYKRVLNVRRIMLRDGKVFAEIPLIRGRDESEASKPDIKSIVRYVCNASLTGPGNLPVRNYKSALKKWLAPSV